MELAGGFYKGDRVVCGNLTGTILGLPARIACRKVSVAVHYDIGQVQDERVVNLRLLEEPILREPEVRQSGGHPSVPRLAMPEQDRGYAAPDDAADDVSDQDVTRHPQYRQEYDEEDQEAAPEYETRDPRPHEQLRHHDLFADPRKEQQVDSFVDAILEKISRNFANLRMAFRALDRSGTGFVSRADFYDAVEHIFLADGCSHEDIDAIAERFDLGREGELSYEEFCALVEGAEADSLHPQHEGLAREAALIHPHMDPEQRARDVEAAIQQFRRVVDLRYGGLREAFRAMDKSRRSVLGPSDFASALGFHGVVLSPSILQDVWSVFDQTDIGQISYSDFCRVMSQQPRFGMHLTRQMYK